MGGGWRGGAPRCSCTLHHARWSLKKAVYIHAHDISSTETNIVKLKVNAYVWSRDMQRRLMSLQEPPKDPTIKNIKIKLTHVSCMHCCAVKPSLSRVDFRRCGSFFRRLPISSVWS
ncbi:unnamed protein product [Pylaiella littoralis]